MDSSCICWLVRQNFVFLSQKKEHNPLQQLSLKHFQTRWIASTCTLNSLTLVFLFCFWATDVVRSQKISPGFICLFCCNAATVWAKSEVRRLYLNLYSAVWSSSRGLDGWQVRCNNWENSHNYANQASSTPPNCSPFCVSNDDNYAESWSSQCSQCMSFFFFFHVIVSSWSAFVWGETCCCGRTGSGLLGARLCSEGDVFQRTSSSIRLSLTNLHFWGEPAPWPGFPQNWGEGGQFSPQGNSLAK